VTQLDMLKEMIQKEIDGVVVKDTYTKGKNAGLRKCLAFIDDIEHEYIPSLYCSNCNIWTRNYSQSGKRPQCGEGIRSGNSDQDTQPDLYFEGTPTT
jgi:hypothetical protein